MKTLILLLTAGLAAPAFAQSTYGTETTNSTTTSSSMTAPSKEAPMTNDATTMDQTTSGALTDRSGSSTTMDSSSPAMAPATAAPATATTETTSRTYREDTGRSDRVFGGFYIEPGIVGEREDVDLKSNLTGSDTTGTSNAAAFDLKIGGHVNDMFFLGADGRYARSRFEDSAYNNADATSWNWGPTVGLNAPYFGGRVWASYIVDGNYDPDQGANNVDLRFKDPYGWRAGVGIRLSAVSLNLEYEDLTYRTTDVQSVGTLAAATSTSGTDFAQRGYALSLSFPIDL